MKKFLVLMLSLVLVFSLASCKSKAEKEAELEAELNKMAEDLEKELEKELAEIEEEEEKLAKEMEEENAVEEEESQEAGNVGEIDYSLTDMELLEACAPLISRDPFADADNLQLLFTDVVFGADGEETTTDIEFIMSGGNYSEFFSSGGNAQFVIENFDLNKRWTVTSNDEGTTATVGVPDDPNAGAREKESFTFTYDPATEATDKTKAFVDDVNGFKYLIIDEPTENGSMQAMFSLPDGVFAGVLEFDAEGNPTHQFMLDLYDTDSDYSEYVLEPEGYEWTEE